MLTLPIQTARLVLRRFGASDLEAFQGYRSDAVLAELQGWEPEPDDQARSFLEGQARQTLGRAGEWLQVAVVRRDTGELVGDLGLCVVDERDRVVELGFTVSRSSQKQGFASEAVRGVLDALWSEGTVGSVIAVADARNTAARALLKRLGFEHQSTEEAIFRGEPCLEETFVLTAAAAR